MKIGIIGHFGGNEKFVDGQTVKTKNLKRLLDDCDGFDTYIVDTYFVKHNKIKVALKTLCCLLKCRNIVILLSVNGMNFYLPFFYYANKLFHRHIYHDIIGSELVAMTRENPKLVKYLNSLEINWFEYESGANALRKMGVNNVAVLPNCKKLEAISPDSVAPYTSFDGSYTFCTFSRVMRQKGITDAINSVAEINEKRGKIAVRLDIYGPVEDDYKDEFDELTAKYADFITYRGITESHESVQTLKRYYALLFPTKWHGEGFPGTILDCYASAIPVLASDWNANKEIVVHGKTGMIYPSKECKTLTEAIEWALYNKDKMDNMKLACRAEYEKYTPEYISNVICTTILEKK